MSAMTQARDNNAIPGKSAHAAVILVAALVAIYSISQFFRNSIGVIGPDLAREFDLDARGLGMLASVFFLSFAVLQIPLGMLIDRHGPKASIIATALIAVAGSVLFARANSYSELIAARLLIGAGCSSFFMGSLAIYAETFSPQRFSTMVGIQLGVGTSGALIATAPLAWTAEQYGWRTAFIFIAALTLALTFMVALLVREDPGAKALRADRREDLRSLFSGVLAAARVPSFWAVFFMQATSYSALAAVLGLWGGPWLAHVYGMDLAMRGKVLFAMVVVQIIGLFIWGPSDRWFSSYRTPGLIGGAFCLVVVLAGAVATPSPAMAIPYLLLYGLVFSITPVLTAHGRSLFPPNLLGRGLTLINIGTIGGVFVQQNLTGWLMDQFEARLVAGERIYPAAGYRAVFALLAAEIAIALIFYARTVDPHPNRPLVTG